MSMENIGHSMASRGVNQHMISTFDRGTMDKIAGFRFGRNAPALYQCLLGLRCLLGLNGAPANNLDLRALVAWLIL